MKKKEKRTIYCGVEDMDGNPVKLSDEARERFIKNMSNNGELNVVFCETNAIPKMMQAVAAVMTTNNK
jgi:hypothetical protein